MEDNFLKKKYFEQIDKKKASLKMFHLSFPEFSIFTVCHFWSKRQNSTHYLFI